MDVGLPLEMMTTLPWEVAATGVCGAVTDVDGRVVQDEWWIRDGAGRLTTIVKQQPDRKSWTEVRFAYDDEGRLVRSERWDSGDREPDESTTFERDDHGRLVKTVTRYHVVDPTLPPSDNVVTYTLDRGGHVVGENGAATYERDAKGRIVTLRDERGVFATVEWGDHTARERVLQGRAEPVMVFEYRFDDDGAPLSVGVVSGESAGESTRWLRDCSALPPRPAP